MWRGINQVSLVMEKKSILFRTRKVPRLQESQSKKKSSVIRMFRSRTMNKRSLPAGRQDIISAGSNLLFVHWSETPTGASSLIMFKRGQPDFVRSPWLQMQSTRVFPRLLNILIFYPLHAKYQKLGNLDAAHVIIKDSCMHLNSSTNLSEVSSSNATKLSNRVNTHRREKRTCEKSFVETKCSDEPNSHIFSLANLSHVWYIARIVAHRMFCTVSATGGR